jgi:hypothetical protein
MSEISPEHRAGQAWDVLLFGAVAIGVLMAVYIWTDMRTINPKILDRGADTGRGICVSCAAPPHVRRGIAI